MAVSIVCPEMKGPIIVWSDGSLKKLANGIVTMLQEGKLIPLEVQPGDRLEHIAEKLKLENKASWGNIEVVYIGESIMIEEQLKKNPNRTLSAARMFIPGQRVTMHEGRVFILD